MSHLDNGNSLEKQFADLQLKNQTNGTNKLKKIPPAVPPKNKAQPQIPHSVSVNTLKEPSYSSRILPVISNNNRAPNNIEASHKDYNMHTNRNTGKFKSQVQTYSNLPTYRNSSDELPPPPPPPLPTISQDNYDQINEVDDYLPAPPSPVSSNYSELMRAASNINKYNLDQPKFPPIYQNDYSAYSTSQASTYESLYEPINPHPQNNNLGQASLHSNRSLQTSKSPLPKEEEVDALTNLLVKSISDGHEPDVFGVCVKCNEKVVGESSGCTAMGNMYHVKCFCCQYCNLNLQGKAFYAVDGFPYCETDYLETLEKCSVCEAPILDRILRATGKPYHPTCFTCVVCGKSLDGIPFTVDAMNQIHCIDDFHKKFAPRCCVCELPIMPEDGEEETVRIVALDRSFHVRCYRCEDCGLLLTSEAEGRGCYPLDNHILCKNCNAHRIRQLTNVMTTDL